MGPVVKIVFWWDFKTSNWVSQAVDAEDNQVGDAEYSPNRKGRQMDCKALALQHNVTTIEHQRLCHA